jgi:hypothetical protein
MLGIKSVSGQVWFITSEEGIKRIHGVVNLGPVGGMIILR